MFPEEIQDFLSSLELCEICIRRYVNKNHFNETDDNIEIVDSCKIKRLKPNICKVCLGIFEKIDSIAEDVILNGNLQSYECNSLYSSISIPITLLIRDLSIWIALIQKFDETIDNSKITIL